MAFFRFLVMNFFQVLILLLSIQGERIGRSGSGDDDWKCSEMDQAVINFRYESSSAVIRVDYQYVECNDCDLISLLNMTSSGNKTIDSYYSYRLKIQNEENDTVCSEAVYSFKECGVYFFDVDKCEMTLSNKPPFDSNNYIYIAAAVAVLLVVVYNLFVHFWSKYRKSKTAKITDEAKADSIEMKAASETASEDAKASKPKRLQCLDTFRGLSLVLMIFVNYGSGGYKQLQHKPWHGITIADFVFPWFLFIMGVSTVISINSLAKKQTKFQILTKVAVRFVKLFAIGIILNSRFGVYLNQLRIFGVLQRIGLCYLFVASLEAILYRKQTTVTGKYKVYFMDLISSWAHWLVISLLVVLWFLLTYVLPVPGCPTGYIGPGGFDSHSMYKNCTGGAAGYVDKVIFSAKHLYGRPTCMKIYQTTEPFDPEGLLGTLNSILLTFLGAQAGRIIMHHKSDTTRLILFAVWTLVTLVLFGALTFFDLENGPIPVNKNLWTLTYTLITACSSFLIILVLYFIIDMKHWWNGSPIIQPGMNSIVIYFCHSVFSRTFPVQWLVSNTHVAQIFLNLWGSVFWTGVAVYLYNKNLFYNL